MRFENKFFPVWVWTFGVERQNRRERLATGHFTRHSRFSKLNLARAVPALQNQSEAILVRLGLREEIQHRDPTRVSRA